MKTKILIFVFSLCAVAFFWLFRNPLIELQFAEGFPDGRRVKLIAVEPVAERQLLLLVENVRRDAEQWDRFDAFVSTLESTSLVIESMTDGLKTKMRAPEGSYFLFSTDKRAAFVKFVELTSDTKLNLSREDYVIGY